MKLTKPALTHLPKENCRVRRAVGPLQRVSTSFQITSALPGSGSTKVESVSAKPRAKVSSAGRVSFKK